MFGLAELLGLERNTADQKWAYCMTAYYINNARKCCTGKFTAAVNHLTAPHVDENEFSMLICKAHFWATVCKTVRPVPSDRCLFVCPVCL